MSEHLKKIISLQVSERILYFLVIFVIVSSILLGSYLPMTDMPQHAAQVVAINDILTKDSPWANMVQLNYSTPYLTCYIIWLILYQFFNIVLASKIMVAGIFVLWVIAWVLLRKSFRASKIVDWVILPSFFGFPYVWGFIPYLLSMPVALLFFLANKKWADNKISISGGVAICLFGTFLFFTHMLGYCFGCLLSYTYITIKRKNIKEIIRYSWPYLIFLVLLIQYLLHKDPLAGYYSYSYNSAHAPAVFDNIFIKLSTLAKYPLGFTDNFIYAGMALIILPLIFMRPSKDILRYIPLLCFLLVWFTLPHFMNNIFFIYQRYAVFFFGTYFLVFDKKDTQFSFLKAYYNYLFLSLVIVLLIGNNLLNIFILKSVSEDFQKLLTDAPTKRRLVYLDYDISDPLTGLSYLQAGSWYQAERKGWSDFNFAWFSPAVVRYLPQYLPTVKPGMEWNPAEIIATMKCDGTYDLVLVRAIGKKENFIAFEQELCAGKYKLRRYIGHWGLYEYKEVKELPKNNHQKNSDKF